jgi:hypothetical protein
MRPDPTTLKVLFKLVAGDTFFVDVSGMPPALCNPSAQLHFVHFAASSEISFKAAAFVTDATVGEELSRGRSLVGTVQEGLAAGTYLLSGVSFKGKSMLGKILVGSLGTTLVPIEPRLGFCIEGSDCGTAKIDSAHEFLKLVLL